MLVLRHAACADGCDDAGIYVGTTGGAVFYSRDSGDSWALLEANLPPILALEVAVV